MNGNAQVKGLQTASGSVTVSESPPDRADEVVVTANRLPEQKRLRFFECGPNAFASRHLAHSLYVPRYL